MTTRAEVLEAAKRRWPHAELDAVYEKVNRPPDYWRVRAPSGEFNAFGEIWETVETAPTLDALLAKIQGECW